MGKQARILKGDRNDTSGFCDTSDCCSCMRCRWSGAGRLLGGRLYYLDPRRVCRGRDRNMDRWYFRLARNLCHQCGWKIFPNCLVGDWLGTLCGSPRPINKGQGYHITQKMTQKHDDLQRQPMSVVSFILIRRWLPYLYCQF